MANQLPSFTAYTIVKRENQDDYWLNIGAAFMHSDGDGFNVVLQALPINGKIVLRLPKSRKEEVTITSPREPARRESQRERHHGRRHDK
jgi:hypothetical protein